MDIGVVAGLDDGVDEARIASAILQALPQGIVAFDNDLRILFANESARSQLGVSDTIRPCSPLAEILPGGPRSAIIDQCARLMDPTLVPRRDPQSVHSVLLPDGGAVRWNMRQVDSIGWIATIEPAVMGNADDQVAQVDPLTGLPSRAALTARLAHLSRDQPALLLIDLDRFKAINDTLGHPAGDALLRLVARRLCTAIRGDDLLCRLGGDEFAIVVEHGESAEAIGTRLVDLLSRPYLIAGQIAVIGASIGLAQCPTDGADAEELMRSADLALYQAKAEGRGMVRRFSAELAQRADARHALEVSLRLAVVNNELELYFQPQVGSAMQLTGFEALLRWRHPTLGLVSPGDFIPLAEETRLIEPIGEWALRTASHEAQSWALPLSVAVNVSAVQLADSPRLCRAVEAALASSGLDPSRLELEITESALIQDTAMALRGLHALRELGISIAMDDFGTGYSSLSQLRSYPFNRLKIDRSFVSSLGSSDEALAVVRAIAALGASLGMRTTAEGVETGEQADHVVSEGCTDLQGYLISRPVPAENVPALITDLGIRFLGEKT